MFRRLRSWVLRLIGSVHGARRDDDLADELRSHLQLHVDDNLRAGMAPEEARRQAVLKLGGVEPVKERVRDRRGLMWLDALARDVKYAVRFLRRSPGFTAVAVLSLALGIGANTAIFSFVDSLMLRSLPVNQPDRLVELSTAPHRPAWTYPLWEQLRTRPDLFDGSSAWAVSRFSLTRGGATQYADGLYVSGDFFEMLGIRPTLGRAIGPRDDHTGGGTDGPVAVISDGFWHSHFGGAPDVLGQTLALDDELFTIVGVTPPGFHGVSAGMAFDVAVPIGMAPRLMGREDLLSRFTWWFHVLARLKPGETIAAATAGLRAAQPTMRAATLPSNYGPRQLAGYLQEPFVIRSAAAGADSFLRERYAGPLLTLMVVVALVLLIACVNLANLLLARADGRRHELSVRLALGASRGQLVRQLMIEHLLLAGLGAAIGLAFAAWSTQLLDSQLVMTGRALVLDSPLGVRVLGFTTVTAIAVALLFGTAPALRATSVRGTDALTERGGQASSRRSRSVAGVLMIVQVALCLVLVVGTGLFVRTFASLVTRDLGFEPGPVLQVGLDVTGTAPEVPMAEYDRLIETLRTVPGVSHAAVSSVMPLDGMQWDGTIEDPDGLSLPARERDVYLNAVSPDWFATLGTPLVTGRDFARGDTAGAPPVAIVNQTFARKYLPHRNPLGAVIRLDVPPAGRQTVALTIVGVAKDAVYVSRRDQVPPTLYRPFAQGGLDAALPFIVASAADGAPPTLARDVTAAVSRVDPTVNFTVRPFARLAQFTIASERMLAMLSGFFGVLALLLAAIGLYGVVSYTVNRRRTEIGIRMALGARPGGIVRLMLARIGVVMGIGLALGGVLSLWLAQFVKALLYDVQPSDPITLAGAVTVLAGVGLLASWLPARRAARIDPMEALREQ